MLDVYVIFLNICLIDFICLFVYLLFFGINVDQGNLMPANQINRGKKKIRSRVVHRGFSCDWFLNFLNLKNVFV